MSGHDHHREDPARGGFWSETVVRSPDAGGEWHLGGRWTASADGALAWLRDQALRLATALDPPADASGPFPAAALRRRPAAGWDPGGFFADWAADHGYQRVQRAALLAGRPISVNTRGPDRVCGGPGPPADVEVLYSLSARPVPRTLTTRRLLRSG
ncbi:MULTISPECIES: hypothetical protein [unclassified Streptomyces]|uniref:hypothetical protein n=1 Tax=unclassified Streptomyces TaxID=2593676 RepID=UPI000CD5612A|nr:MULTISPECIES: hypothetical protein [unclassified Streptomyces]